MTPDQFLALHLDPGTFTEGADLSRRYFAATGRSHVFADAPGRTLTPIKFEAARMSPAWICVAVTMKASGLTAEQLRAFLRAALPRRDWPPRADDFTVAQLQAMPSWRRILIDGAPRRPLEVAYRIHGGRWFAAGALRFRDGDAGNWSRENLTHFRQRKNLPPGVCWDRANRAYRVRVGGVSRGYFRDLTEATHAAR